MISKANSQFLQTIIHNHITASPQQRMTFAEYMDLVLYHPEYGYYSAGTVGIGKSGDFFTSSSLGVDFGELLAQQLVEIWEILKKPVPFTVVEMGAGQGSLANDILQELVKYPDVYNALEYIIVEQAPQLITRQQETLQPWLEEEKIGWRSLEEISDNSIVGCCFSNELVDAFPVHRVIQQENQLQEIYVTLAENQLAETVGEPSTPRLAEYFELIDLSFPSAAYPEGYRTEVNLAALDWLATIARKLLKGYLITIDYGYTAQRYYSPQRQEGTLQCYYQHRRHDHPYALVGQQDLTAHVDFTALERQGEQVGLDQLGFVQQGLFLMALGLGERLSALSSGMYSFQEVLQRRDALHQLIDPTGLGGFGVLVQSKGLTKTQKEHSLKGLTIPPMI
jgi:SAM-dependent MidA family methyltransferase